MPSTQIENDAAHRPSQHLETAIDDLRGALRKYGEAAAPALGIWFSVPVVAMAARQFRAASASLITALRTMRAETQAAGIAPDQDGTRAAGHRLPPRAGSPAAPRPRSRPAPDAPGARSRFLPDGDQREE